MKKIKLFALAMLSLSVTACGGEEEKENKEPQTFDEKAAAVCDCFENDAKDKKSAMNCFKKQHDYSETFEEEERVRFIQETNKCAEF